MNDPKAWQHVNISFKKERLLGNAMLANKGIEIDCFGLFLVIEGFVNVQNISVSSHPIMSNQLKRTTRWITKLP